MTEYAWRWFDVDDVRSRILNGLGQVAGERRRRAVDRELSDAVAAVKRYQQSRLARTYADLKAQARYRDAVDFFLDELYGPGDFDRRDTDFARIVPGLVRLFPREIVETVSRLVELHALSEQLDTAMGEALRGVSVDDPRYALAWHTVGDPAKRDLQRQLALEVGHAIDRYTRHAWVGRSLRAMRTPARIAGLMSLQTFLERGFAAFERMNGAEEFLATIDRRERDYAMAMFSTPSIED